MKFQETPCRCRRRTTSRSRSRQCWKVDLRAGKRATGGVDPGALLDGGHFARRLGRLRFGRIERKIKDEGGALARAFTARGQCAAHLLGRQCGAVQSKSVPVLPRW